MLENKQSFRHNLNASHIHPKMFGRGCNRGDDDNVAKREQRQQFFLQAFKLAIQGPLIFTLDSPFLRRDNRAREISWHSQIEFTVQRLFKEANCAAAPNWVNWYGNRPSAFGSMFSCSITLLTSIFRESSKPSQKQVFSMDRPVCN